MTFPSIRVVVAAASPSARAGLRRLLADLEDVEIIGDVDPRLPEGDALIVQADVVVLEVDGDEAVSSGELLEWLGGARAVVLGAGVKMADQLASAGQEFALLPIHTHPRELAAAIRAVREGLVVYDPALSGVRSFTRSLNGDAGPLETGDALSEREREVLRLLAEGLTNKRIAQRLGISEHTAKFHVSAILSKLGAESRTEAVAIATRRGLVAL